MKNSKKILFAIVAVALLCATFVTGALALVAGENTTPLEYMQTSTVVIKDDFNDGQLESPRDQLELIGTESYAGSGYMFYANRPDGYVDHVGEAGKIQDGALYGRNGADNVYTNADESKDEGNLYYNVNYYAKNGQKTDFFFTWMFSSTNDGLGITQGGLIIEFDINMWYPITATQTAGQDTPEDTSDDVYSYSQNAAGWVCPPVGLNVMNTTSFSNGALSLLSFSAGKTPGYVEAKSAGNTTAFPANTWQHITIQYDASGVYRIYIGHDTDTDGEGNVIGRQLLAECNYQDPTRGYIVRPATMRVGAGTDCLAGEVGIDNLIVYQGTTVHDPDFFNGKPASEIVAYLASLLENDNVPAKAKNDAFDMITKSYLSMFWDGSNFLGTADDTAKKAINDYFTFKNEKYNEMLEQLKVENTVTYANYVAELDKVERTLASINDRNAKVTAIQNFLASIGASIDRSTEVYKNAETIYNTVRAEIKRDENAQELINQMAAFQKSYSIYAVSAMTRRFEAATAAYKNYTEDGIFTGSDAEALANAVKLYIEAQDIMVFVIKDYNSERFINLVGLYKNTTEEDWKNDDGTIRRYWYLSRSILLENNYNPNYSGMAEAQAFYETVYNYFWAVIQQEHIDILAAKLENFNKPNATYIEQAGVCTFVNNYVKKNQIDIDPENMRINELIKISAGYEALLSTIKDDYQKSLVQNTEKFIHIMSLISSTKGYANIMPLYEEATTLYYSMNIESEEAVAAVAAYEKVRTSLINTETDCALFVAKVAELQAEKNSDKAFKILADCYSCTKYLDETYEGVAAAKAVYDAKMAEHQSAVVANEEIAETADVICSVRSFDSGLDIIKLVKNLLGI